MPTIECAYCGRVGHAWFQCARRPEGWKPEANQSTAARKDVRDNSTEGGRPAGALDPAAATTPPADTQALPVDPIPKRGPGRPSQGKTKPERATYMREYMRERRAKLRGKTE